MLLDRQDKQISSLQESLKYGSTRAEAFRLEKEAAETLLRASIVTPNVVESRIEDEFTDWDGETIFKLVNGQIWQQSSYAYTYHYAYRPEVLIAKASRGYTMHVEGVDSTLTVVRLR